MADVVFTPVFNAERYKYHQCSECGHHIRMEQQPWGGIWFGDKQAVKFCPHCGNPVIRFSEKAVFETPIDFEPLRPFYDLRMEYEDKCRWLYHCYISDKRREKIEAIIEHAKDDSGWVLIAAKAAAMVQHRHVDWRIRKKLLAKFGDQTEGT